MTIQRRNFTSWLIGALVLALFSQVRPAQAQAVISNNQGAESKTWTIIGEPTLVMNGFDLSQVTSVFPVTISAASIQIVRAVPGQPVSIVIYEDPNGGSPSDARIIHKTDTTINDVATSLSLSLRLWMSIRPSSGSAFTYPSARASALINKAHPSSPTGPGIPADSSILSIWALPKSLAHQTALIPSKLAWVALHGSALQPPVLGGARCFQTVNRSQ